MLLRITALIAVICLLAIFTGIRVGNTLQGDLIAFERTHSSNSDIYILDVRHLLTYNLTRSPVTRERFPTWSPDGKFIAYQHQNSAGETFLYVIDYGKPETARPIAVLSRPILQPAWSPDGCCIAFSMYDPEQFNSNIYVIDLRDGFIWNAFTSKEITQFLPRWSPDGKWMALTGTDTSQGSINPKIFIAPFIPPPDVKTKTLSSVFIRQVSDTLSSAQPAWTADSQSILFTSALVRENLFITDVNEPGSDRPVANLSRIEFPHVSPDGTQLVFSAPDGANGRSLYRSNLDGSNRQRLTRPISEQWIDNVPVWMPRSP